MGVAREKPPPTSPDPCSHPYPPARVRPGRCGAVPTPSAAWTGAGARGGPGPAAPLAAVQAPRHPPGTAATPHRSTGAGDAPGTASASGPALPPRGAQVGTAARPGGMGHVGWEIRDMGCMGCMGCTGWYRVCRVAWGGDACRMVCGMMWCPAGGCSAMPCSAAWCCAMQHGAVPCRAMQCGAVQRCAMQHGAVQCHAVQFGAVPCRAMP